MEPDAIKTAFYNFALAEADGDIHRSPRGVNNHGQKLLAERSQAKRADRNWLSSRREFCIRLRPDNVISTACHRCQRRLFAVAL